MDTLKSLMDKHEYELVIKLTEKSGDVDSIFYRISALLAIGQGEKALAYLKEHHIELHKNLLLLIKVHIDLLLILGRFDEAYDELDYYKNLPYESQQVEELLSSMVGHIREEERAQYGKKSIPDEEIKSRLKNNDKGTAMSGLEMAGNRGVEPFIKEIQYLMLNNPSQAIKSFALMLLVQKKWEKEVEFKSKDSVIKVIPANTKAPFIGEPFNRLSKRMISEFKNPTISDNAISIFSSYIIDIYPNEVAEEDDYLIASLYLLSCDCLQIKDAPSIEEYCDTHKLDESKVKELYNRFAEMIQNF
ncbi:MAG: hypothetical protein J6T15_07595 [Bacilli bacterium]|nr:hypothetical protein [Bacilli bacterium]